MSVMNFDVGEPCVCRKIANRLGRAADGCSQKHCKPVFQNKALKGVRVAACLHVTSETAVLMRTQLKEGGASVIWSHPNPHRHARRCRGLPREHDGIGLRNHR